MFEKEKVDFLWKFKICNDKYMYEYWNKKVIYEKESEKNVNKQRRLLNWRLRD